MILQQVQFPDQTLKDIRIEDGIFTEIADRLTPRIAEEVIRGHEKLILPPFVDAHVHLDSTLTAGQPKWNENGSLFDGLEIWSERKKELTYRDVKERATLALKLQACHGVQFVRCHVDISDPSLKALKALIDVRENVKDWMTLQLVAFPQEGLISYPNGKELLLKAIKLGADVVGANLHAELNSEYGIESLEFAYKLAQSKHLPLDVHTDEIDDPQARNLEILATMAYESGQGNRITASNAIAMGTYNESYTYKLMELLKKSEMNFVATPLTNMYSGDQFDNHSNRRSLTRVKELVENGLNVAFGEDNIKDPWYPMGNGNMFDVLQTGLHGTQMMGRSEIVDSYKFITFNGARVMNIEDQYGIEIGKPANFVLLDAHNFYDALNRRAAILLSARNGQIIGKTKPAETELYI